MIIPTDFPSIMALYSECKRHATNATSDSLYAVFAARVWLLDAEISHWTCPDKSGDYARFVRNS